MLIGKKTGLVGLGTLGLSLVFALQAPIAWGQATDLVCAGCVQATDIANGTIGPNKLIPGSVNTSVIATNAIRSNKILDGAVQGVDIRDGGVTSIDIQDSTVTGTDIAPDTITAANIASSAVGSSEIAAGAVTLSKLAVGLMPEVTKLQARGSNADDTVSTAQELMRTLGSFTKLDANSDLKLIWTSHGKASPGAFCDFQLRIDGVSDDGSSGTASSGAGRAVVGATNSFGHAFAVATIFRDVPAGSRSVEVWLRGTATTCSLNGGNFFHTVIIEEFINPSALFALALGENQAETFGDDAFEEETFVDGIPQ